MCMYLVGVAPCGLFGLWAFSDEIHSKLCRVPFEITALLTDGQMDVAPPPPNTLVWSPSHSKVCLYVKVKLYFWCTRRSTCELNFGVLGRSAVKQNTCKP
jgi:hypothetical protein